MKRTRSYRLSALTLALVFAAQAAWAQAQQTKPFEPQVGQPGKDVVWVPTPQALVDKMLDIAKVTPQDYLIDLGSGDGRTVITAAKRGLSAHGIEYDPEMVALSQRNAVNEGVSARASFAKADLFESDFSKATVVTMFLLPSINLRLRPKLLEMKPGTRVVSNTFTMEDWEADEMATIPNCNNWCNALLSIVPAKVEGSWQLPQGELVLTQQFQKVSGTFRSKTGSQPIANGKMTGDQISFLAGNAQYTGRVNGNTIEGSVSPAQGGSSSWRATKAAR